MSDGNPMNMYLIDNIGDDSVEQVPIREGFGDGLLEAGKNHDDIVGICADLTSSTKMSGFAKEFPDRFFDVGVAEQNLVTIGTGMAAMGKHPFVTSYAAFCPGRCWEQIRTTIALNDQPVKIIGSHAGISVGPDGATHQMLEDIALMRSLPNMIVVAPGDSMEAMKATLALAEVKKPAYMRLAREKTPVFTTEKTPFELGKAYVVWGGHDITLLGTGTMTYQCLVAAKLLQQKNISAEVVHVPTVKPLDKVTILASVQKTGKAVTAEEAQINAGFGGAIAELLSEEHPVPLKRIGMKDQFGESGEPNELLEAFGLTGANIAAEAEKILSE